MREVCRLEETVIWGDVLFCIDFSMDLCALYFVCRILGARISLARLCVSACICAAVGVVYAARCDSIGAVLLLIGWIASYTVLFHTHVRRIGTFLSASALFLLLEASAGGLMTAGFLLLRRVFLRHSVTVGMGNGRLMLFWLLAAGVFFLLSAGMRLRARADARRLARRGGEVRITIGGREVRSACLFDSGNLVREPISGKAVVFLPAHLTETFGIKQNQLDEGTVRGSRLIPIRTACGAAAVWGIRAEVCACSGDLERMTVRAEVYAVFSDDVDCAVVPTSLL